MGVLLGLLVAAMGQPGPVLGVQNGQFTLDGIRPGPRGSVRIEVRFAITSDGIVSVAARDVDTGQEQAIRISGSKSLEEGELKEMTAQHRSQLLAKVADEVGPAGQPAADKAPR